MPNYLAPDIYVEEVAGGARPIEAVGASTAGFVGVAPNAAAHPNEAVAINNWMQFVKEYVADSSASTHLSNAVYGFFQNGGGRCYVVNVGEGKPISGGGKQRTGLDVLEQVDEVAIVAAPGFSDAASYDALLEHCERLEDRVAILDAPAQVTDIDSLTKVATAPGGGGANANAGLRARQSENGYGAYYFPWLIVRDPLAPGALVNAPPSGHVAGIWARTDAARGVHKAPANAAVRGALNLTYHVSRAEQAVLNPAGVNCIRFFGSEGILVWGARTLAAAGSEWRYLNVRRLFNVIKESIALNTRWIVFEPNDYTLWKSIRRDIRAFLMVLWRDGALMGRTPDEAFFVKCDEETNTPDVVDAGRVVTLIGVAPVKPAEFIVFRLSQYASGSETQVQGG
jgi:phage tail sheath protein FI